MANEQYVVFSLRNLQAWGYTIVSPKVVDTECFPALLMLIILYIKCLAKAYTCFVYDSPYKCRQMLRYLFSRDRREEEYKSIMQRRYTLEKMFCFLRA
jgi:hypothetical protein